jgi:hypothetical protein
MLWLVRLQCIAVLGLHLASAAPCAPAVQTLRIETAQQAKELAALTTCERGSLTVQWLNTIVLSSTIAVGAGTTLTVTGINGAVLDGNNSTQLFSIAQSATLLLDRLQLKHGRADRGAAVYAATGAVLTISNCEFSDNFAELQGGAVAGIDSNVSLTNCAFRSNSARQDGEHQTAFTRASVSPICSVHEVQNRGCIRCQISAAREYCAYAMPSNQTALVISKQRLCSYPYTSAGGALYIQGSAGRNSVSACSFERNYAFYGGERLSEHRLLVMSCTSLRG